ncbi:hypothetical protein ACFXKG_30400 [Streptomyces sp. NPDC059255]|uniref:hypothetical protein n=1 Tax=Streptomyces sp. NPDC059255 TaxID=3346793 RepID=UPI0036A2552E
MTDDTGTARPPRGRWLVLGAVALAVVMASALTVTVWQNRDGKPDTKADSGARVVTAVVTRTDLSNAQTLNGTLGYGRTTTVKGGKAGLITWLPAAGATVRRGEPLYRVDNVPVPVFYGATPLYRTLAARGTTGPDVKMVADNLRGLGYDIGAQPPMGTWIAQQPVLRDEPDTERGDAGTTGGTDTSAAGATGGTDTAATAGGTTGGTDTAATAGGATGGTDTARTAGGATGRTDTAAAGAPDAGPSTSPGAAPSTPAPVRVERGDGVLTGGLVAAVKRWQTRAGLPATGTLGVGDLSVLSGAVRVDAVQAQLADAAEGPMMTVTSTTKSVTVAVEPADAGSMKRGDPVTVVLPDSSTAEGSIGSIGATVQLGDAGAGDGNSASGQPQMTVGVTLGETAAVRKLNSAPVQVRFTSETRKGVLAVPVGALLALREGGYAVQLPGGRLVAVKTGMFSKGVVEISGSGIGEGTKVVTTS